MMQESEPRNGQTQCIFIKERTDKNKIAGGSAWSSDLEIDTYLLDKCLEVAKRSKHLRMKVGCVVAKWWGCQVVEVLATGYNRLPPRVIDLPERYDRPLSSDFIEHAERDALATACREGLSVEGALLYVTWHPCADCARAIINSGIREVILDPRTEPGADLIQRWCSSQHSSGLMLKEAGVLVREGKLCYVENRGSSTLDDQLARHPEEEVS